MQKKILLDTGIVSRYITGVPSVVKRVDVFPFENLYISLITFIELQNWLSGYITISKNERTKYRTAINSLNIIHIDNAISKLAFEFSKNDINGKPNDLIIAATKKIYNCKILTLNHKDFDKYKDEED